MAREVLTLTDIKRLNESGAAIRGPADSTTTSTQDEYFDRLLKYIPAEVVACYIFVLGLIQNLSGSTDSNVFQWVIFFVFCFITFLYLWRILRVRKMQQLAISVIAFGVWVFAIGGPFTFYEATWYNPIHGQIVLPIFTLLAAIWEAK